MESPTTHLFLPELNYVTAITLKFLCTKEFSLESTAILFYNINFQSMEDIYFCMDAAARKKQWYMKVQEKIFKT